MMFGQLTYRKEIHDIISYLTQIWKTVCTYLIIAVLKKNGIWTNIVN